MQEQMKQLARMQLTLIRGEIAGEDQEIRDAVEACAGQLRRMVQQYGDVGHVALQLVAAESEAGVLPREDGDD